MPSAADEIEVVSGNTHHMCRVLWTVPAARYIVVRKPDGREVIAIRKLGAWMEMAMTDIIARLERLDNLANSTH